MLRMTPLAPDTGRDLDGGHPCLMPLAIGGVAIGGWCSTDV